jgi:hypothetical protein
VTDTYRRLEAAGISSVGISHTGSVFHAFCEFCEPLDLSLVAKDKRIEHVLS